jgi:hypothetical protein
MTETENLSKLIGIPKIFYLNYDESCDKKKYMESQFEELGICNYERISKNKYSEKNYDEWKDLIFDKELFSSNYDISNTIIHLKTIIDWYDNDTSDYCIIMDDYVNIKLCNYWMFDWETLIMSLPYNWDCIQLFGVCKRAIPMHLRPKTKTTKSTSCYMITRHFAKKIKHLHHINGKLKLHINTKDTQVQNFEYGTLEHFLYELGVSYSLPVFNLNKFLFSDMNENNENIFADMFMKLGSEAIEYWWKAKSKQYSTYEFFTFNKNYDWKLEVQFDNESVWRDDTTKLLLWI